MEEETHAGTNPAPAAPAGDKKNYTKLIVIGVIVVVAIVAARWFLSPERIAEQAIEQATGGSVHVNTSNDGGNVTVTGKDGSTYTASSGDSVSLPDGWPSSVPLTSDAKLTYAAAVNGTENSNGFTVMYDSGMPPSDIVDMYKTKLAANGWTIESTVATGQGSLISATMGDNDNVVVNVGTGDSGTSVNLSVQVPK